MTFHRGVTSFLSWVMGEHRNFSTVVTVICSQWHRSHCSRPMFPSAPQSLLHALQPLLPPLRRPYASPISPILFPLFFNLSPLFCNHFLENNFPWEECPSPSLPPVYATESFSCTGSVKIMVMMRIMNFVY